MRKPWLFLTVLFLSVAGSATAVDYTFQGTSYPALWDTVGNWNPSLVLLGTTGDSYTITSPTSTDNIIYLPDPADLRYFGSLTMTSGTLRYDGSSVNTDVFRFMADNNQDGSFTLKGVSATAVDFGKANWNQGVTWDMDGSFIYDGQINTSEQYGTPAKDSNVILRGTSTTFTMSGTVTNYQQFRTVTVETGASVALVAPTFAGYNAAKTFVVNGTVSGKMAVKVEDNKQNAVVAGGADVDELDLHLVVTSNASDALPTQNYQFSGAHYQDVEFGAGGWLGDVSNPRTWTVHIVDADLRARNLSIINQLIYGGGSNGPGTWVLDTDNGGVTRDVTVDEDVILGTTTGGRPWNAHLKANASDVTIGRDLLIRDATSGSTASFITATSGTWKLGRDLTVDDGAETLASGWDMGATRFICNGNMSGNAQMLTTKGLPFYHFEIDNPAGTVTLADNLLLKGDLTLTDGTFDTNGNYVILSGGQDTEATAQEIDVGGVDLGRLHLKAASDTYAKLLSDLIISDNLDIDDGCVLFLNGHMLTLAGSDAGDYLHLDSLSGEGTWTVAEGGQIIGTVIPEPATLLLVGTGLLGVLGWVRRRRMS